MPQSEIATWLSFVIQQIAAESYLDGPGSLAEILVRGNNRFPFPETNYTRLTQGQAQQFVQRYQILDHHASDATGFSATLLFDTQTTSYTMSIRSTEFQNQAQGGDWQRDGLPGADGEILSKGFAFGQLVSLEKYYQQLKSNGVLPTSATLNVTGYSLGGHLATVFTELHAVEIQQTYTFNGAGRGELAGGTPGLSEGARIAEMLEYFSAQLANQGVEDQFFASGATGNLYTDSRYQTALQAVFAQYQPTSLALSDIPRSDGAFGKITQLVGQAVTGHDFPFIANAGVHAAATSVLIEGQPVFEGFDDQGQLQIGNTHSLVLLVDSLAVQDLFEAIDPDLAQADIEGILKAASNAESDTLAAQFEQHTAEGDTLELALDALRTLFVPAAVDTKTDFNDDTGGFGDLGTRTELYAHLAEVQAAVANQTFSIEPLVQVNSQGQVVPRVTAAEVIAAAQDPGDSGLAYRYALRALNPFAVIGADYVGLGHAADGQLALYDPASGFGELTEAYLTDRAAFLLAKLELTLNNQERPSNLFALTHYQDGASGFDVPAGLSIPASAQRKYLFGSEESDTLSGRTLTDDHLYGGAGDDALYGFGADDYLQGDSGNDLLDGGSGSDWLHGGVGFDTYVLESDGADTVDDGDARGMVQVDGVLLVGGLRRAGDPANTYQSSDGQFTFVQSGSTLTINNALTIEDWQPGELGITLRDLSALSDGTPPVINYANGQPTITYDGDATDNAPIFTAAANHIARGFGGNDILDFSSGSALFNHQIFGGDDHDELRGGAGHDRLFGEGGRDLMTGGSGDDVMDGGAEIDLIHGDSGQDALDGGAGNDGVDGGAGDDVLFGGIGDNQLVGGGGEDVLFGGDDHDLLVGDYANNPTDGFDDTLNGGAGNDVSGSGADKTIYVSTVTSTCSRFFLASSTTASKRAVMSSLSHSAPHWLHTVAGT